MAPTKPFVVACNRDRDFYQVPLALFEYGLLDRFVTDTYCPDALLGRKLFDRAHLGHRRANGLPSTAVQWNYPALFWQVVGPRIGMSVPGSHRKVEAALSKAALNRAVGAKSNLFLYSQFAFEAFSSPAAKHKLKGLFKFHPETKLIREILLDDYANHPECRWSIENEEDTADDVISYGRGVEEWRLADFVVCASTFTARSLVYAGCEPKKIFVVPYGVDSDRRSYQRELKKSSVCRFLFVGQGVQRKGLHHLLKAWRRAKLPSAELTVIAYRRDPGIAALAGDGVRILDRQSSQAVAECFDRSHIFILPSLVEGFGLVYLEALASGCYCIGTPNTGLPDLQPPVGVAEIVPVGNIAALAESIERSYKLQQEEKIDADAIRKFAETLSWKNFRKSVGAIAQRHNLKSRI